MQHVLKIQQISLLPTHIKRISIGVSQDIQRPMAKWRKKRNPTTLQSFYIFCIYNNRCCIQHTCLICFYRFKSLSEIYLQLKFTLLRGKSFHQNPYNFCSSHELFTDVTRSSSNFSSCQFREAQLFDSLFHQGNTTEELKFSASATRSNRK